LLAVLETDSRVPVLVAIDIRDIVFSAD
jgi:hypothetical protein